MLSDSVKCFHQYVRNPNNGDRVGVIVAMVNVDTGAAKIGWSKCNPVDRYNRLFGLHIASGRMEKSEWINPKNPGDQQRLVDRMHSWVADTWLYGGVYNRVMLMIAKGSSANDRVPITSIIGETSEFEDDDNTRTYRSGYGGNSRIHMIDESYDAPFDNNTDAHYTGVNDPGRSAL